MSESPENVGSTVLAGRVVGSFAGSAPGPLVVALGGLHGNEPAGVTAGRRVVQRLGALQPHFTGKLVVLAGNLCALGRRCRYVEEDLNRIWYADSIQRPDQSPSVPLTSEESERLELLDVIQEELAGSTGPAYFLDLHTTSAPGTPFSVLADTLSNRRMAEGLPAPMVLGLEEHLDGTFLNYINELGHVAIGFEGGQHADPSAIEAHELAIWRMLVMAGCVAPPASSELDRLEQSVREQSSGSPAAVEIRYRHAVRPDDAFVMEPGFRNLQPVARGELLARDRHGDIRASEDGLVLMPLYQSQGEDGFFLVRRVRPFWLSVAVTARRWRLDRYLKFMPGVRPHPSRDAFIVNPLLARWFVIQVFHLMGFRRQRAEAGRLVLTRRRETPGRR